ncbi:hypothetical protein [Paenibacillus koleovorans]|uniref:hypothetical protein n=1 Tax=Paenibacillus koleovorans TaxID=121608 RepID=UPI000FD9520D|nr:hypothetical protein [Paenibacillus koleovorans]
MTFTAAHEIGHFIGLHERYDDLTGTGCTAEVTVMNGAHPGCPHYTGPQSNDISRVDNFLGNGYASSITASVISGFMYVNWDDYAFGEINYRVKYQKLSLGVWNTVATSTITANTGLVGTATWKSPALRPGDTKSISSYGSGTYRVEITPYFQSYGQYGIATYSSSVTYLTLANGYIEGLKQADG